jgi:hypothetical protein
MNYDFDRFLRYDEMVAWLEAKAKKHPSLLTLESYGTSYKGRPLVLATITNSSTGAADSKPAHWIDANIHATEVTGGVAALFVIHYLLENSTSDRHVIEALATRTFYIAPRVNPDGVEDALQDSPLFHRSSVRPWPWRDGFRWPGLHVQDIDGDGTVRTMRLVDPDGAWIEHPTEPRVMIPVGPLGAEPGVTRYRLLDEGLIENFDGFTVPMPRDPAGLDLNRNFPAGWGTQVLGSGDHPMSEPEVDALVRAVSARKNVCGYNAFHTSGGFLLRPSSTRADSTLPPFDLWAFNELAKVGTELTTYPAHSVYEDLTWDKSDTMSGAGDDWAYEHLGVFGWTTEFWDAIYHATGDHSPTDIWYVGPTPAQELAVCRWSDTHAPGSYSPWKKFDHPQLGSIEIGGADWFHLWTNAPSKMLRQEVAPHAKFAVYQALASPRIEIKLIEMQHRGDGMWSVRVGIANTGWLSTQVTSWADKHQIVLPLIASISGATVVEGSTRAKLGQLDGRVRFRVSGDAKSDGTPDRVTHTWLVSGRPGDVVTVTAQHQRAGTTSASVVLE